MIATVSRTENITNEDIKFAFEYYDVNGDGLIDARDFEEIFCRMGQSPESEVLEEIIQIANKGRTNINLIELIEIVDEALSH